MYKKRGKSDDNSRRTAARRLIDGAEAVFFDAGFTLIEPIEEVAVSYLRMALDLAPTLNAAAVEDRIHQQWRRRASIFRMAQPSLRTSDAFEAAAWRQFTSEIAEPFPELHRLHEVWHQALVSHFSSANAWRLAIGAAQVLDCFQGSGKRVGVLSNWNSGLRALLEDLGIAESFDFVCTSCDAGWRKPHTAIFQRGLAAFGTPAECTVHVGDVWEEDVVGARACGLRAVWICRDGDAGMPSSDSNIAAVRCLAELMD